jgi:integrase
VRAAIQAYLADRRTEGQDVSRAVAQLKAHVLPRWGQRRVCELTAAELRAWRDQLAAKPARRRKPKGLRTVRYAGESADPNGRRKRRSTVNRITTLVKAALNYAARLHPQERPNAAAWREGLRAFARVDAPRERWLEREEVLRLLAACEPDFRRLVRAALYTGCRYGELRRARVDDYDRATGTLQVPVSKSGRSRVVILHDEGAAFFAELAAGRDGGEPLLTRGTRRSAVRRAWDQGHQVRPMQRACRRAGLRSLSFHGLRHTHASLAVQSGMALLALARNLGHADTRMVERHYGHLSDRYLREQVQMHVLKLE